MHYLRQTFTQARFIFLSRLFSDRLGEQVDVPEAGDSAEDPRAEARREAEVVVAGHDVHHVVLAEPEVVEEGAEPEERSF